LLREKEKEEQQLPQEIVPPSPSEIQVLTEKLDKSTRRVFEVLNQNTQLKNELKMAQKCLQQEIGENVNVSQLLSGNSNWRGRAQEIGLLKNKIADLKEKFETSSFDSYDEASRMPLKRLESMRRLEVESLSKELEECKSQLEEVKTKFIALKTRNKNLSDDSNNYKLKTLDLLEKSSRDEEFIKCLNEQIAMLKYECNHKTEEMKKEVERAENAKAIAEVEIEQLHCQLNNLQESLSEKDNEIGSLKHAIEELEHSVREMSGDFLFSCRQMNKDEYIKLLKNLEEEKNNLLNYMQQLNERLDKESMKVSEQQDTIHKQKSKILRFEAKIKEFENEKTALKAKHRRTMRINEYSQSHSSSSIASVRPATHSKEKFIAEIDKQKFK
jgi:chromosome segregation ATPase